MCLFVCMYLFTFSAKTSFQSLKMIFHWKWFCYVFTAAKLTMSSRKPWPSPRKRQEPCLQREESKRLRIDSWTQCHQKGGAGLVMNSRDTSFRKSRKKSQLSERNVPFQMLKIHKIHNNHYTGGFWARLPLDLISWCGSNHIKRIAKHFINLQKSD